SPKPPVCTARAGLLTVAGSEVPDNGNEFATTSFLTSATLGVSGVEKEPVTTFCSSLGLTGTGTLARSSLGCNSTFGGSTFGSGGAVLGGVSAARGVGGGGWIWSVDAGGCGSIVVGGVYNRMRSVRDVAITGGGIKGTSFHAAI